MDSLRSAPGNGNSKKRLKSAVFAIAASVVGTVNAATASVPKFTEEPAGSTKLVMLAEAQKSILNMLPTDHPSRTSIMVAIESLKDGGSIDEITKLHNWAQTIINSHSAPPAAKVEANKILDILVSEGGNQEKQVVGGIINTTKPKIPPLYETREEKEQREKVLKMETTMNNVLADPKSVNYNSSDTATASLRVKDDVRVFTVKSKGEKNKNGNAIKATANITIYGLVPGTLIKYTLLPPTTIEPNAKKNTKDIVSIRLILLNKENKPIDLSGSPDDSFCLKIESGSPQDIIMPPNSVGFTEKIDLLLDLNLIDGDYKDTEFRAGFSTVNIIPKQ